MAARPASYAVLDLLHKLGQHSLKHFSKKDGLPLLASNLTTASLAVNDDASAKLSGGVGRIETTSGVEPALCAATLASAL